MIPWTQSLSCVALALAAVAGCEAGAPARSAQDATGLPQWETRSREVFDDNIDPAAVGLSMDGPAPRADAFLRERSQIADVVGHVRVQTVTVDSVGDKSTYHLGIQLVPPVLVPTKIPDKSFELVIRPASPSFGVAHAFDARMRGRTFIGFIRRFRNDDGETEIHWHLAADTADVAAAVKEAVMLQGVKGP